MTHGKRETQRNRGQQREGVGVGGINLSSLSYRPVEQVNSGVPEVPIVAQISDNDLCLAMIVSSGRLGD